MLINPAPLDGLDEAVPTRLEPGRPVDPKTIQGAGNARQPEPVAGNDPHRTRLDSCGSTTVVTLALAGAAMVLMRRVARSWRSAQRR